jgi:hypothetical protein
MLWARNRRKIEYAGAKMMISMIMVRGDGLRDDCLDDGFDDDGIDEGGIGDDRLDDYGIDDGIDGEGELRYEILWAGNRRKIEYAEAKTERAS